MPYHHSALGQLLELERYVFLALDPDCSRTLRCASVRYVSRWLLKRAAEMSVEALLYDFLRLLDRDIWWIDLLHAFAILKAIVFALEDIPQDWNVPKKVFASILPLPANVRMSNMRALEAFLTVTYRLGPNCICQPSSGIERCTAATANHARSTMTLICSDPHRRFDYIVKACACI